MRRVFALALAASSVGAAAQPAKDLAASFGARPAAWGVAMSPDGSKISYLAAMPGAQTAVIVADPKAGTNRIVIAASALLRPTECQWKTDARIVCRMYGVSNVTGELLEFTRVFSVDANGGKLVPFGQRDRDRAVELNQYSGRVLNWLPDDPEHVLMEVNVPEETDKGTTIRSLAPGTAAQRINVITGTRAETVEPGNKLVRDLDADATGAIRFKKVMATTGTGYIRDGAQYLVRPKGSREWKVVGTGTVAGVATLDFDGFDESGDNLLMLKKLDDRLALYKLSADGSGRSELVFAHPKVDVDGVLRIGKYHRPVAASYTVNATGYSFFDPALVKLSASLAKALKTRSVDVLDESWDGNRKLVFAGSDSEPGRYYMFDRTTKELNELVQQRPDLSTIKLATVTSVEYPARDGTMIPAHLTLPNGVAAKGLPTIIMPYGGPLSRDTLGFDWVAQFFAAQGYAVLQPNFRGASGYGEAWYAKNGFKSWPTAIGDINDGARWMASQGTADGKRMAVFGWSYGGYAALQGAATEPGLYKAVVAVSPITDLAALKNRARNFTNYRLVSDFVGDGPFVTTGSPARNAKAITAPVLLFHGEKDIRTNAEQSYLMRSALKGADKPVDLVVYPELDHQLDDSGARADMLRRSAAFIGTALGK